MEAALSLDSTFLIDLQREFRLERVGPARRILQAHPDANLWVAATAWGEFLEGVDSPRHPVAAGIRRCADLIPVSEAVAERYGQLTRDLRAAGRLIGTNDLWIAAAAIQSGLPLVTRNAEEFGRVPGLRVLGY